MEAKILGSVSKSKLPGEAPTTIEVAGGQAGMAASDGGGGGLNGFNLPVSGSAGV